MPASSFRRDEDAALRAWAAAGITQRAIAFFLGRTLGAVQHRAKRLGIAWPNPARRLSRSETTRLTTAGDADKV